MPKIARQLGADERLGFGPRFERSLLHEVLPEKPGLVAALVALRFRSAKQLMLGGLLESYSQSESL